MRFLFVFLILGLSCKSQPPTRPLVKKDKSSVVRETDDLESERDDNSEPEVNDGSNDPIENNSGESTPPENSGGGVTPDLSSPMTPDTDTPTIKNPETPKNPVVTDPTVPDPVKPDPVVPTPKPLVLENGIYTIKNKASGKCLEVTSLDKGSVINQFGCNGSRIQAFRIETVGTSEYKITNIDTRKAFGIRDASKSDNAGLEQNDFANGEHQTFLIDNDPSQDGFVRMKPKHSMRYLDIESGSLKSKVQPKQLGENKKDSQKWKLTKIAEPNNASGVRYYFVNECDHDVWVASQNNPGFPVVKGDFKLAPGEYRTTDTGENWEGRFWGRYNCKIVNGKLTCESGQCAKGEICGDVHGEPPVAIAEFKTRGYQDIDFYDISLVDGTNLPMDIRPMPLTLKADGAKGSCKHLECKADLRLDCPAELQKKNAQGKVIGCMSACEVYRTDEYCCLGAFRAPNCFHNKYSKWFDQKCPDAYSFAEDTKTFTCRNADYEVIFCPK